MHAHHTARLSHRPFSTSPLQPGHPRASTRLCVSPQAVGRHTEGPASSAQQVLDRRSLLLGVVVGSQLLSLPRLQSALAIETPEIKTVSGAATADPMMCFNCVRAKQQRAPRHADESRQSNVCCCVCCRLPPRCLWQGQQARLAGGLCSSCGPQGTKSGPVCG